MNNHTPYKPSYNYLPPIGPHLLTPLYDTICFLMGLGKSFKRQALSSVPINDGETIADIGCATGVFLELAKNKYRNSRIIGIDPDAKALAIAKKRLAYRGLDAELYEAFAESLPLPNNSVDICFSTLAFHHMPDDVKRKALEEMMRILKPFGRIVIADFGPTKGYWLRRLLFFEKMEYLKGNLDGVIPQFINELGFKELGVAGKKFPGIVIFTAKKGGTS